MLENMYKKCEKELSIPFLCNRIDHENTFGACVITKYHCYHQRKDAHLINLPNLTVNISQRNSSENVNYNTELQYGLKWKTNNEKNKFSVHCHVQKYLPKVKPQSKAPKSDIFKYNFHGIHDLLCTFKRDLRTHCKTKIHHLQLSKSHTRKHTNSVFH